MEKLLFDQSPRSTLDMSLARSNKSMNSSSSFSSSSSSYSPYPSATSQSHLLYNYNGAAMPKVNSVRPLYQNPTEPFSPSLSIPQPNQPPLLPLPLYKQASFPSKFKHNTVAAPSATKRKPRTTKKDSRVQSKSTNIPLERKFSFSTAVNTTNDVNDMEEEILIARRARDGDSLDCYSISPPPSSLPLPGLALLRPKMKNSSVDNGATDDLRRILRI